MHTTCPRCGTAFTCEADSPAPCACFAVRLGDAARAALRADFDRCVCVACLRAVQAQAEGVRPAPVPPPAT